MLTTEFFRFDGSELAHKHRVSVNEGPALCFPLSACFSENSPLNCLHKTPALLHKKQMLREPSLLRCLCVNVFRPNRFVGGVQIKLAQRGWSNLRCQHRWDFLDRRRCLPDWLSLSGSPAITHTYEYASAVLEQPNYLQVNYWTLVLTEIPVWIDWVQPSPVDLTRKTLTSARIPQDSLITCHWYWGEWKPAITTFMSSMMLLLFPREHQRLHNIYCCCIYCYINVTLEGLVLWFDSPESTAGCVLSSLWLQGSAILAWLVWQRKNRGLVQLRLPPGCVTSCLLVLKQEPWYQEDTQDGFSDKIKIKYAVILKRLKYVFY